MDASSNAQSLQNASSNPQAQASAVASTDSGPKKQQAASLTAPTPAEGIVTTEKLDKAAEWAAYSAMGECVNKLAAQLRGAAPSKVAGARPKILLLDLPIGIATVSAAGGISKELERRLTELDVENDDLDALLRELEAQTAGEATLTYRPTIDEVIPELAGAEQEPTPIRPINLGAIAAGLIAAAGAVTGGPATLSAITASTVVLPELAANIGSVVTLAAASLAYLRADYTIRGATVEVSEHAMRAAVAGALSTEGIADVTMLDLMSIEQAKIFETYGNAIQRCVDVKRKVEALSFAAQVREMEAAKLAAWNDVLHELRWTEESDALPESPVGTPDGGTKEGTDSPAQKKPLKKFQQHSNYQSVDATILDEEIRRLDAQLVARRADQLRYTIAAKKAAVLAAGFETYAAKLTSGTEGNPAPIVLAALRETVNCSGADVVLHVKLDSVGGETTTIGKWLFWFGGALTLTGYATISYILADPTSGSVAAAGVVGSSTSTKRSAVEMNYSQWECSHFAVGGAAKPVVRHPKANDEVQQ